jgi:sigma-B regulation protein RsbU (phosphoserine phosphatase)
MSNLQAAVKAFASESTASNVLCERVNQLISNNIARGKFITFFYGLVDGEARRLTYTNAGHNPPIVIRPDGTALRLDTGGALLGVFPDWKYQQGDIELGSGDRLVLFTDGVSEVQDSEGHEFGEERLIQLLTKSRELNAVELQQKVIGEITAFSSGDFHDDVTLLLMAVL